LSASNHEWNTFDPNLTTAFLSPAPVGCLTGSEV
jgi:hypothetical protein